MQTGLKVLLGIAAVGVVAYLLIALLAWRFQERMAFPAPKSPLPAPQTLGIPDGERVSVTTADNVTLHGWYLPANPFPSDDTVAPALIWFYGNMETVEGIAPVLRAYRPPGIAVLVLDYRGYGASEGSPTEAGVYRDAEAAWQHLTSRAEIDSSRIAVYGRSIGSAVALHLATHRPVRTVVLDSPISSGRAMAEKHYSLLPQFLNRLSLDNLSRAGELDVPLLVFHGTEDRIVPIEMGRAIADTGRAEAFVEIEGAGHNDTYMIGGDLYRERLHEFLARQLGRGTNP